MKSEGVVSYIRWIFFFHFIVQQSEALLPRVYICGCPGISGNGITRKSKEKLTVGLVWFLQIGAQPAKLPSSWASVVGRSELYTALHRGRRRLTMSHSKSYDCGISTAWKSSYVTPDLSSSELSPNNQVNFILHIYPSRLIRAWNMCEGKSFEN